MVESTVSSLELIKSAIDSKANIGRLEKSIAVLFADLCDSTAYKLERGDVDGLLKTYRHNAIVIDAITKTDGHIVKFIGDEVMATFDQGDACDRALETALEIQSLIREVNASISGAKDEKISSKIGINYGSVLMVQFPGNEAQDPQGKVVDAAARIVSLAKPNQILCSESVRKGLSRPFQTGGPFHREAKGITHGINVYEVLQGDDPPIEPKLPRHTDLATDQVKKLLIKARKTEYSDNSRTAASEYTSILHMDSAHFSANYRAAQLAFKHNIKLELSIQSYAEQASKSRPDSGTARAQNLVFEWYAKKPENSIAEWDRLIVEANNALEDCYDSCDYMGEMICLNLLAYYISERLSLQFDRDLFEKASEMCENIHYRIGDFKSRFVPAFYETHAKVLSLSEERSKLERALDLASESVKLRQTSRIHETISQILRKIERLG